MNRIDALKNMRKETKEGILSVTLPPCDLWDLNKTDELVDMLLHAGVNQLLLLVSDADSSKMAEIAPVEVELLKRGFDSGYHTEMISKPMYHIRERYPDLPLITTAHVGEMAAYGIPRYIAKCKELEIDGLDCCAYQYVKDPLKLREQFEAEGIYHITAIFAKIIDSQDEEMIEIIQNMTDLSTGELYVVPGMLGHPDTLTGEEMKVYVDIIRQRQEKLGNYVPLIGIGGVRSPENAYEMVQVAGMDGVHTSTSFMQRLLANDPLEKIEAYLGTFKDAING